MRRIAFVLLLSLGGCPGLTGDSPIIVDSLCTTSATILTILTVQKSQGELTPSQIALVDQGVGVIDPICSAPSRPSSQQAIVDLERGLLILQGVKGVQ